jgi:hypothetical protein
MADKKISALPSASTPLAGTEVLPIVQGGTTDQVSVANLTGGRTVDMAVANVVLNDAGTNSVSYPVVATHTSSGTTAPGFGVGVNFIQENTTYSTNIQVATIESVSTSEADIHNDMVFKTKYNNTLAERARIKNGADFTLANGNFVPATAGKGIDFSANTPAAGMTSELLNWYEEGTWTPADASGASLSFGNTTNNCFYTRVGNVVTCMFALSYPSTASGSSAAISGLPFTSKSTALDAAGGFVTYTDASLAISLLVNSGASSFALWGNSGSAVTNANMSGRWLRGVITYFI